MPEWINDGEWYCSQCDLSFKVYVKEDEGIVSFCPCCASRNLDVIEEGED